MRKNQVTLKEGAVSFIQYLSHKSESELAMGRKSVLIENVNEGNTLSDNLKGS